MAGGTFTEGVDKVRPGLYINFRAAATARMTVGERGTVVLPLPLNWGPTHTFVTIQSPDEVFDKLGYNVDDPAVLPVREALKEAQTVLVYRMNGSNGTKAQTGVNGWGTAGSATAVFQGTLGAQIHLTSAPGVVDETLFTVRTYVGDAMVDEQVAHNYEDLKANAWVEFGGIGQIEAEDFIPLLGGTNGTVVTQDYVDFLAATETQQFDVIGYPVSDDSLKATFVSFVKRMRDEEGKKIVGVVANYDGDFEGIINVDNGVILNDGTALDASGAVPWVAAASAGATITQSNTYKAYTGAKDANPRYKNSDIAAKLKAGRIVFVNDGRVVKVEQDINSLHTLTDGKNERFQKNRVIRVLDGVNNDLNRVVAESYIGVVNNDADGQALLTDAVNGYLGSLQRGRAIQNFDPKTDFIIDKAASVGENVVADIGIQPIDSMEKFYFRVGVK